MRRWLQVGIAVLAAASIVLPQTSAARTTQIFVPAGTKVGLIFDTPVDSGKAAVGARVRFHVAADVMGSGHVLIRAGSPVTGTVAQVTKPGMFGSDSKVVIGALTARAVDRSTIHLTRLIVSKALVSNTRVGAAGASAAGAIVLGPVGLLAGALVRGSNVSVPAGTAVTDTTETGTNVNAP